MNFLIASCLVCAVAFVDGETYRVGVVEMAPFVVREGNSTAAPSGYIPTLLQKIADIVDDVEYEYMWTDRYGYQDPDGQWQGLVGQVIDGDVDIGAAALTINSQRVRVVDFSRPYMSTGITIAMKKPDRGSGSAVDFGFVFRPFSAAVWVVWILCFLFFIVAMFLLNRFHPFEHRAAFNEGKGTEKEARQFDAGGSFWLASTLVMLQGFDRVPRSKAGKLLFLVWADLIVLTVILYATNMSNQIGSPPGGGKRMSFSSLDEILDDVSVQMGYIGQGSTAKFFQDSHIDAYERVSLKAEELDSYETGLDRVRQGDFALFLESPSLEYHMQKKPCDIMKIGGNLNSVGYGFAFQKGSALKDTFDEALLRLRESGDLQKLYNRFFYDQGQCPVPRRQGPKAGGIRQGPPARPLTIREYFGPLILYILGLIVVVIVAVIEVFYEKFKNRPKTKKEKLLEAEEGTALNQTTMSALNDTAAEPDKEGDAAKEEGADDKKAGDVGVELEPEDKEKSDAPEAKDEDPDRIESVSSPVEVKA